MSLFTFGTFDTEFRCLQKELRPSYHILDDSESFGGREMIADMNEISKHITSIYKGENHDISSIPDELAIVV